MAFALPVLIVMIWMFVQLAQIYRALAGIQQALGEGARYATCASTPTATGLHVSDGQREVQTKVETAFTGSGRRDIQRSRADQRDFGHQPLITT